MKIFVILSIALILRLINLNQSLWLDEAVNVAYSQKFNFVDFLIVYPIGDFHPPLYFGVLWVWTHIFGISEIAVRIPSVIFGILAVWLTYLIGRKIFDRKIGLSASLILAFNPLHVYYSQEARMYSLATFSVVLSFWALINLIKGRRVFLFFYGLSVALVLYSDYLAYFSLAAQLIYVIWQERKKLAQVFLGMFLGSVLWSPWLLIFPKQLTTGQVTAAQIPGWAEVVGGSDIKDLVLVWVKSILGRVSFNNKMIYAIAVLIPTSIYLPLIIKAILPLKKETKLLLCWLILPVILAFLVSFYIPILSYFRMVFILPALSIFLSLGISKFSNIKKIILGVILVMSLVFLSIYYLDPKFQREDWRGAISFVNQSGELVLFEDIDVPSPAQYYSCSNKCSGALLNFPANSEADVKSFDGIRSDRLLLFNYLVDISDPYKLVQKKLENSGYRNTRTWDFHGVGFVYEYSK